MSRLFFLVLVPVVAGLLVWMPVPYKVPPTKTLVLSEEFTLPELVEHCEAMAGQIWLVEGDYYTPRAAVSEERMCFIRRYGDDGFAMEWQEIPWPEKP